MEGRHNRADVVLARCSRTKAPYGMRLEERQPGAWTVTWAFPMGTRAAAREGYGASTLEGRMELDSRFPGCPHCHDGTFVLCHSCARVACAPISSTWFVCPWCTNSGPVEGHITALRAVGD